MKTFLLLLLALLPLPAAAQAPGSKVTVHFKNQTSLQIREIYVTPHIQSAAVPNWGNNQLNGTTIVPGGVYSLRDVPGGYYDLKIVDSRPHERVVPAANLTFTQVVALTDSGAPAAIQTPQTYQPVYRNVQAEEEEDTSMAQIVMRNEVDNPAAEVTEIYIVPYGSVDLDTEDLLSKVGKNELSEPLKYGDTFVKANIKPGIYDMVFRYAGVFSISTVTGLRATPQADVVFNEDVFDEASSEAEKNMSDYFSHLEENTKALDKAWDDLVAKKKAGK